VIALSREQTMHTLPMTSLGYTASQQEIKDRLHARPKLIERLRQAMTDDVNLTENSEYQAAVARSGCKRRSHC